MGWSGPGPGRGRGDVLAEKAGLPVPQKEGICATCVCQVPRGPVSMLRGAARRDRKLRSAGEKSGRFAAAQLVTRTAGRPGAAHTGAVLFPRGDLLRVRYFTHDPELQASPARTPRPPRSLPSRGCWPCRFTPPCPSGFTRRSSTGRAAGRSRAKARPSPLTPPPRRQHPLDGARPAALSETRGSIGTRRTGQLYATSEFLIFSKCFTLITWSC